MALHQFFFFFRFPRVSRNFSCALTIFKYKTNPHDKEKKKLKGSVVIKSTKNYPCCPFNFRAPKLSTCKGNYTLKTQSSFFFFFFWSSKVGKTLLPCRPQWHVGAQCFPTFFILLFIFYSQAWRKRRAQPKKKDDNHSSTKK